MSNKIDRNFVFNKVPDWGSGIEPQKEIAYTGLLSAWGCDY